MSYILEALKKANAERALGSLPGLHTPSGGAAHTTKPIKKMLGLVVVVLLLLISLLLSLPAWRGLTAPAALQSSQAEPVQAPIAAPNQTDRKDKLAQNSLAQASVAATAARLETAPLKPPESSDTAAQTTANTLQAPAKQAKAEGNSSRVAPAMISPVANAAGVNPSATPNAAPSAAPNAAPSAISPPERSTPAAAMAKLPNDLRQALPNLVISGATYSDNPALRMLIINGQVFREGDAPVTGLLVVTIKANSARLQFKGQPYSVSY